MFSSRYKYLARLLEIVTRNLKTNRNCKEIHKIRVYQLLTFMQVSNTDHNRRRKA